MINWQSVISNTLWILGLAILLSALSYHYWLAHSKHRRLRRQLQSPGFQTLFWLGLFCFAAGLVGTSTQLWEAALWGLLGLWALINLAGLARRARA